MNRTCPTCLKTFASPRNLRQHRIRVHNEVIVRSSLPFFKCSICSFQSQQLNEMYSHYNVEHSCAMENYCPYCLSTFTNRRSLNEHLESYHRLPSFNLPQSNLVYKSAFNDSLRTYTFNAGLQDIDLLELLISKKEDVNSAVRDFASGGAQKVQLSIKVALLKPNVVEQDIQRLDFHANTIFTPVYGSSIPDNEFTNIIQQLMVQLHNFSSYGSGWIVERIQKVELKLLRFSPFAGSSFIPLPPSLQGSHGLLNIRNSGENCFLLCFTACWHLKFRPDLYHEGLSSFDRRKEEYYSELNPIAHQAMGSFNMPMSFEQLELFENFNDCAVYVFTLENGLLVPRRVTKNVNATLTMDLLLLTDGAKYHYVLITNLESVVCKLTGKRYRAQCICRNCMHLCGDYGMAQSHYQRCAINSPALIKMPDEERRNVRFTKLQARWYAPYVGYFDLESILVPVQGCQNDPTKSSTQLLEKHVACSFGLLVTKHGDPNPVSFKLDRSEDCINVLLQELIKLAKDMHVKKRQYPVFVGIPTQAKEHAYCCWICGINFFVDEVKVLDHCHATGKFLGWAHEPCNLNRKTLNYTPVLAHNLQNYDLHHLCASMSSISDSCTFSIIPCTDEKYISLQLGVKIRTYRDRDQRLKTVFEYIRLIDSYKFMLASLDTLSNNLPRDKFTFIDSFYGRYQNEDRELLKKKGFYPYAYMDSFERFDEDTLPDLHHWKNSLNDGKISISQADLTHANNVFHAFDCMDLGDYHDLHLTVDVLLLASVFEEFRRVCYDAYGLDCAQYYTASNLTGDACIRVCEPDLELLDDKEHLEIAENLMTGGISSVFEARLLQANNKYMKEFKPAEPSTFGLLLDANNLY